VLQADGQEAQPELGVVAGRSVGNAVRRNRAKRRLREAAHLAGLRPKTAYVVVASPDVVDVPFGELAGWFEDAVAAGGRARDDRAVARTMND
jgi:ribonuclease P protein component